MKKTGLLFFIILSIGMSISNEANAASLYISPSSQNYTTGETVTLTIFAESTKEALNAVSGSLTIPSSGFSIVSVSSAGSVVNFWVKEPSSSGNTVSFEGVVLNPGYRGSGGKIATVTLRARAAGEHTLQFANATILANDGKGTSILSGTRGATLSVGDVKEVVPAAPPLRGEEVKDSQIESPDTEGPIISLFKERARTLQTSPFIEVDIEAFDDSNIQTYELSLNGGAYIQWIPPKDGIYRTTLAPGTHTLSLRVVDSLGNESQKQIVISVASLPIPLIETFPSEYRLGSKEHISGTGALQSTTVILIASPEKIHVPFSLFSSKEILTTPVHIEGVVKEDGTWSLSLDGIKTPGTYLISVSGKNDQMAASFPSEPVRITVKPSLLESLFVVIFSPILLLVLLGVMAWLVFVHRDRLKGGVHGTMKGAIATLHKSFSLLKRNIEVERQRVKKMGGPLAKKEEELLDAIEKNVSISEKRAENDLREALSEEEQTRRP